MATALGLVPRVAEATPTAAIQNPAADKQLYVVAFDDAVDVSAMVTTVTDTLGLEPGAVKETYHSAVSGAALWLTDAEANALTSIEGIAYAGAAPPLVRMPIPQAPASTPVAPPSATAASSDPPATPDTTAASVTANRQSPAAWHLDVLDGVTDNRFSYPTNPGRGVPIYIFDTPVMTTHTEFAGRARHGSSGQWACAYDEWPGLEHGTAVASVAAGRTLGVAREAQIVSVAGVDCLAMASAADLLEAMDLVAQEHEAGTPGVVNMSLGFYCGYPSLGAACDLVQQGLSTLRDEGLVVVAAAGNDASSRSCYFYPAGSPDAVSVGALAPDGAMASFSNHGQCVDLFAPGQQVRAATNTGVTHTDEISGTSFAAPLVAGMAAVMLGVDPSLSPAQVQDMLVEHAAVGTITGLPANTANRSLRVDTLQWSRGPQQGPAPHATVSPTSCGYSDTTAVPAWAAPASCWAKKTQVTSTTSFNPHSVASRAEAVTFLWRAAGAPAAPSGCGFVDGASVPAWARPASCWAKQRGVVTGASLTPAQPVTRAQAVLMLSRAGYRQAGVGFSGPMGRYSDAALMSPAVEAAADWAHAQRITTGNPFRPSAPLSRAELVTMLWRAAGAQ